jgi:membrane protease YdiL (CAAX protease family)
VGKGTKAKSPSTSVTEDVDAQLRALDEEALHFLDTGADLNPARFFLGSWKALDREAALLRKKLGEKWDWHPLAALLFGALCLTLMEYFGHAPTWGQLLDALVRAEHGTDAHMWTDLQSSQWLELSDFVWWAGWRVLGYFLLPAAFTKLVFRGKLTEHGLGGKGVLKHAWAYGLAYCFVLVLVVGVSFTREFSSYYPFYKQAHRSWVDFGAWELLYAAQFFSLEFFFRGFWLKAMRRSLGSYAIFAMVVPYCMIHFSKPLAECLGAILAGVALGTLAMRTRSIWLGFAIHVSVAVSMDVAALLQGEGLPHHLWPT